MYAIRSLTRETSYRRYLKPVQSDPDAIVDSVSVSVSVVVVLVVVLVVLVLVPFSLSAGSLGGRVPRAT